MTSANPIVANAMRVAGKTVRNAAAVVIRPSPSADTRSADHPVTEDELRESTAMHIDDVRRGMEWLAGLLREADRRHDWTKLRYFPSFYRQFSEAQRTGCWGNGWYDRIHTVKERHHLENECPDDVTLIDVLEHIVDCVMAGKARKGTHTPDVLGAGLLERAYANTQKMISGAVRVVEKPKTKTKENQR